MTDFLLEPLRQYRATYREAFSRLVDDSFARLTEESGVDVDANGKTVSVIRSLAHEIRRERRRRVAMVWLAAVLLVTVLVGAILGWHPDGQMLVPIDCVAVGDFSLIPIAVSAVVVILEACLILPSYFYSRRRISELEQDRRRLTDEAWCQMAPLNDLYDWNLTTKMVQEIVPQLKFDRYVPASRLDEFLGEYGWRGDFGDERSMTFVQSGEVNGNPFVFCEARRMSWGEKSYSGSLEITWTERTRDSDGKLRRVVRHQTLTASVEKPCPRYKGEAFLVYGNSAAPGLVFSRKPSELSGLDDGFFNRLKLRHEIRRLEAYSRDLTDDSGYTIMSNQEFEALFHATDRNDEVEFRLLFTPIAQTQMLALLKDKDVGFGDDFAFFKDHCINVIWAKHLRDYSLDSNPEQFKNFNYEDARLQFRMINEVRFRSLYFALAPLLTIPLYQEPKSSRTESCDEPCGEASCWEHESIANFIGEDVFKHPQSITRNILKTSVVSRSGGVSTVSVTAHGYRGAKRVDHVRVYGGDGEWHSVPVPWTEYIPVSRTSMISVAEKDGVGRPPQKEGEVWRRSIVISQKGEG